jgi:glycosyltransferase involved in cell wall biosynthesis
MREGKKTHILQVSARDVAGGAEKAAYELFQNYARRGYISSLAVGQRRAQDERVFEIPNDGFRGKWARMWLKAASPATPYVKSIRGAWRLQNFLISVGQPRRWMQAFEGYEDFDFPATRHLLSFFKPKPDILHCHNLHGGYFDLRQLPRLAQEIPLLLTLHDAWALSGHCAFSFDCDRWKTGCGACPDLTLDPPLSRDGTAYNWLRKKDIYARSRFYLATPSRWLMEKVMNSMLIPGIIESRVIYHGIDLTTYKPADVSPVRRELAVPEEATVILLSANGIRKNSAKDYLTMRKAIGLVAARSFHKHLLCFAVGEDAPLEKIGEAELRFIPFQRDPRDVARYCQAADLYIHAANSEVWGRSITEALACGTPAVATAVGGIPEQIKDGETGFLVPKGDAEAMAHKILAIIGDKSLRQRMGERASEDVRKRFNLERHADDYLHWYGEMIAQSDGAKRKH